LPSKASAFVYQNAMELFLSHSLSLSLSHTHTHMTHLSNTRVQMRVLLRVFRPRDMHTYQIRMRVSRYVCVSSDTYACVQIRMRIVHVWISLSLYCFLTHTCARARTHTHTYHTSAMTQRMRVLLRVFTPRDTHTYKIRMRVFRYVSHMYTCLQIRILHVCISLSLYCSLSHTHTRARARVHTHIAHLP